MAMTALMFAIQNGHMDAVLVLLKAGADIFKKNSEEVSALMLAARHGKSDLVDRLNVELEARAEKEFSSLSSSDQQGSYGRTRLMYAAVGGDVKKVSELLRIENTASLQRRDVDGRHALMFAAERGDVETVKILLEAYQKAGIDIDLSDNSGKTAMILACKGGHFETVSILFNNGAKYSTCFECARKSSNPAIEIMFELLRELDSSFIDFTTMLRLVQEGIQKGISPSIRNKDGNTALILASEEGNVEAVLALLRIGVDVNVKNKKGLTALSYAMRHPRVERLLKEELARYSQEKLEISQEQQNGYSLMQAVANGDIKKILELLEVVTIETLQERDFNGKNALMLAAEKGNAETLRILLEVYQRTDVDINSSDDAGKTALMLASQEGHIAVIRELCAAGAHLNKTDGNEKTALLLASENEKLEVVELLNEELARRAKDQFEIMPRSCDYQDNYGRTTLMVAASSGDAKRVSELLERGAIKSIRKYDIDRRDALMLAAEKGDVSTVSTLLAAYKIHGVGILSRDKSRRTALMLACQRGNIETVVVLLNGEAYLDRGLNWVGETPFEYAAKCKNIAIRKTFELLKLLNQESIDFEEILTLIREGASALVKSIKGESVLTLASLYGDVDVVSALLKTDADITVKNKHGKTALMLASICGRMDIVELLNKELGRRAKERLEIEALHSHQDSYGRTALMVAAASGDAKKSSELLMAGAIESLGCQDIDGRNALMLAAEKGDAETLRILLKAHEKAAIDIDKIDAFMRGPLMLACQSGNTEAARVLFEACKKAKRDIIINVDSLGRNALMLACQRSKRETVFMLLKTALWPASIKDKFGKSELDYAAECPDPIVQKTAGLMKLLNRKRPDFKRIVTLIQEGVSPLWKSENGETALMLASKYTGAETVLALLEAGADINDQSRKGESILMLASIQGNMEVVDALNIELEKRSKKIEFAASHEHQDSYGRTTLMYAAARGDVKLTRELLMTGSEKLLEKRDRDGRTALMLASEKGDPATVAVLLEAQKKAGVDINLQDNFKRTAFMLACQRGNAETIIVLLCNGAASYPQNYCDKKEKYEYQYISECQILTVQKTYKLLCLLNNSSGDLKQMLELIQSGASISLKNKYGETVFSLACNAGQSDIVLALCSVGVDVNERLKKGKTALMCAFEKGDANLISALLRAGADINAKDDEDNTALFYAVGSEKIDVVLDLLKHGVDINAKNKHGTTVLEIAYDRGDTAMVSMLVGAGASIAEKINRFGENDTLLMRALKRQNIEMAFALLKGRGIAAVINEKDDYGQTPLDYAESMGGNLPLTLALLKATGNINQKFRYGSQTILMKAVYRGDIKVLSELLEFYKAEGASINERCERGWTALMYAAELGNCEMILALLKAGASFTERSEEGLTAFICASIYGTPEAVDLLNDEIEKRARNKVESEASKNQIDSYGRTPLMYAASKGNAKLVLELLSDKSVMESINHRDVDGRTALMLAVEKGSVETVNALLKVSAKASIDVADNAGRTALMLASIRGNVATMTNLIAAGASVNLKDKDQTTALMIASRNGNLEAVITLIKSGSLINEKDNDGYSALDNAVYSNNISIISVLLDAGASVDGRDGMGRTLLMRAAARCSAEMVSLLLQKGAGTSIHEKDNFGNTALQCAVFSGKTDNISIISVLLDAGASVDDRDRGGRTLLMHAAQCSAEMVSLLLQKGSGASIHEKDDCGNTALQYAEFSGKTDIVALLKLEIERLEKERKRIFEELSIDGERKQQAEEASVAVPTRSEIKKAAEQLGIPLALPKIGGSALEGERKQQVEEASAVPAPILHQYSAIRGDSPLNQVLSKINILKELMQKLEEETKVERETQLSEIAALQVQHGFTLRTNTPSGITLKEHIVTVLGREHRITDRALGIFPEGPTVAMSL